MKNKVKITQRGRPPVDIEWPDVVFTAQDVVDTQPERVSRVTIHSKLNKAVDQGQLKVVGKVKTKNGRPRVTYQKCEEENSIDMTMVDKFEKVEGQPPLCQG
jgi:hypothetical protein